MLNIGDSIKNDVGEVFQVTDIFGMMGLDELEEEEEEGHYVEVKDNNGLELSGVAIKKETSNDYVFEFLDDDELDEEIDDELEPD